MTPTRRILALVLGLGLAGQPLVAAAGATPAVANAPVTNVTASADPNPAVVDGQVTLQASADGATQFVWDVGNDAIGERAGAMAIWTPTETGTHTVVVEATNNATWSQANATVNVTVIDDAAYLDAVDTDGVFGIDDLETVIQDWVALRVPMRTLRAAITRWASGS